MRRRARTARTPPALLVLAALLALHAPDTALGDPGGPAPFGGSAWWRAPEFSLVGSPSPLFPDTTGRMFRTRAQYFIAQLDSGGTLTLTLYNWKHGLLDRWGLFLLLSEPEGPTTAIDLPLRTRDVQPDPLDLRIAFGDSLFSASRQGCDIWISTREVTGRLTIRNILPPWVPGDGRTVLSPDGGAFIRLSVTSPWANLSGWLSLNGRVVETNGQIYGDQSQAALPLSRQNTPVFSARAFGSLPAAGDEGWFLSILKYTTHAAFGGVDIPIGLLAHAGRWIAATDAFSLEPAGTLRFVEPAFRYPDRFTLRLATPRGELEGQFHIDRIVHVVDVFGRLPDAVRAIASVFFNRPVILHWTGRFRGTLTTDGSETRHLDLPAQGEYMEVK